MQFQRGNKAAANPANKAVAEMIRKRLEKEGDSLGKEEFTALVGEFNSLTTKRRRRRRKKLEREKTYLDQLPPEEAEMSKAILQIEAVRQVRASIGVCEMLGIRFSQRSERALAVASHATNDGF